MMLDRAHVLLKDERKDLRIKENEHLSWQIKYKQREGHARIRNISATGMLMETDVKFDPKEDCILSFDSNLGEKNYVPRVGRLVWNKKKRFSRDKYFCGIKFLDANEQVLARMRQRVQKGVNRFLARRRITTTIGFLVCIALVALMEHIIYSTSIIYRDVIRANQKMFTASAQQTTLTQNYMRLYRTSEASLVAKTEKLNIANEIIAQDKAALALFSKELEATGALLNRTEEMLTESNERNTELNNEIALLQAQVQAQMARQESVAAVANVEMSMAEYRLKLQSIKNEMRLLRNKERAARAAALAKIDDQKLQLGNNGYFVKEGQMVRVNEEQYKRLDVDDSLNPVIEQANRKVEIDVTFFDSP
ncbi:MAG: PilZ domain-containing protein [Candidatus Omnitrophica bacterium]|nr:PilZ domain-containing protein [Candidatus Omnitrophota bacterium]